ncbi:phosphoribosylglycinamide formyltransferase [[Clostridium] cellulosi]|jgi:formyltetrahydrofolate-dependent phosphoribosylglycinamide formyltransferase (EC 2.1.2.2)|uniref:Phosphoribosylglycinamide formyltransferase n=1 Tax=[Clostridium] cellulosi TaxID=29343 RepID=A0A078KM19_9FIRM|nr:MAG: phosphoribosylglycinamide formyltransferase [[Clostridium] cellulosi]CDZ23552.1 phosphoribosylglycinamide formyltransferase [[Clostridium] cellulosi]
MLNIAVLVSGGGTNLQALIDAQKNGIIKNGRIVRVISSREGVYALERAKQNGIETRVVARKNYKNPDEFDRALLAELKAANTDLVVLAGFLSILGDAVLNEYENRIINVHPSLIPSFCGPGFYGLRVHEEALKYGVKVTGATVHFVNKVVDGGAIIAQKAVEVKEGDTPEILQRRVMEQAEWVLLPRAVALFCEGRIKVKDGKTIIV